MTENQKEDALSALLAARTLIDVEGWTQEASARRADGTKTDPYDANATCYCAYGALSAVTEDSGTSLYAFAHAEHSLKQFVKRGSYICFNDAPGRTKPQVLKLFDKAIAKLEGELG